MYFVQLLSLFPYNFNSYLSVQFLSIVAAMNFSIHAFSLQGLHRFMLVCKQIPWDDSKMQIQVLQFWHRTKHSVFYTRFQTIQEKHMVVRHEALLASMTSVDSSLSWCHHVLHHI